MKKNKVSAWILLLQIITLQPKSISWEETVQRKYPYIDFKINLLALSTVAVSSEVRQNAETARINSE